MAAQPMYQQIAEKLRAQIESGELEPGDQLPAELELRDRYASSRNTIRDAIKQLTSQGFVETRPGQGTFVSEASRYYCDQSVSILKVEVQITPAEVSRSLRAAPDTQVVSRHEMRYGDGIPWSLQTSFYSMDFTTSRLLMAASNEDGTVSYLDDSIGVRQVGCRDWIAARVPDTNEQEFFGLANDATVFEMFRAGRDETRTPPRVTATVFPTDRKQLIVNIGDVPGPGYVDPGESA
jgi:GntR family transcriptional regulator